MAGAAIRQRINSKRLVFCLLNVIFVYVKNLKHRYMKKLLMLATAAFLVTGVAFAHEGKGKNKDKAKKTCTKGGKCCGKGESKKA